jgi:hypothetical protein
MASTFGRRGGDAWVRRDMVRLVLVWAWAEAAGLELETRGLRLARERGL